MSVLSPTEIAHLPPKEKIAIARTHLEVFGITRHPWSALTVETSPEQSWRGRSISEAADQIETLEADIAAATSEAARYLLEVVIVFGSIL